MSAHQSLLNWLHEHPQYEMRQHCLNNRWCITMFHVNGFRYRVAFGDSFESACFNLIKCLPQ